VTAPPGYIAVHDVGTIVNSRSLRGQISGGIVQGIGMALYEQVLYDTDGQPLTGTFMTTCCRRRRRCRASRSATWRRHHG
jgi:hypothetical protein